jgi:hypothetical protein
MQHKSKLLLFRISVVERRKKIRWQRTKCSHEQIQITREFMITFRLIEDSKWLIYLPIKWAIKWLSRRRNCQLSQFICELHFFANDKRNIAARINAIKYIFAQNMVHNVNLANCRLEESFLRKFSSILR